MVIGLIRGAICVRDLAVHGMPEAPDHAAFDMVFKIDRIHDTANFSGGVDFINLDALRGRRHLNDFRAGDAK